MMISPCSRSACSDRRRREVAIPQASRERDVRNDILGEMGDGAVGLAVAHRRTVRTARSVHQHCRLSVDHEPLVDTRRGVAFHAPSRHVAVSRLFQEVANLSDSVNARSKRTVADDARVADLGAELRRQRESDVETVGRQETGGAIRPFEQHDGADGQVVEPELRELRRARQPVEIGMNRAKRGKS